jgi:hypothetical protein
MGRYEVLMVMKIHVVVFQSRMQCSLTDGFGGAYCLYLQDEVYVY